VVVHRAPDSGKGLPPNRLAHDDRRASASLSVGNPTSWGRREGLARVLSTLRAAARAACRPVPQTPPVEPLQYWRNPPLRVGFTVKELERRAAAGPDDATPVAARKRTAQIDGPAKPQSSRTVRCEPEGRSVGDERSGYTPAAGSGVVLGLRRDRPRFLMVLRG